MRPVGGQNEQRRLGLIGFDDGRMEIGRRRARRTQQGHGRIAGPRHPQREEAGAPLVDVGIDGDPTMFGKGEREGRGTRPRRDANRTQAGPRQLVHKYPSPERIPVRRPHVTVSSDQSSVISHQ